MEMTSRMREEEARLKGLIERLGNIHGHGLRSRMERLQLTHALDRRLAETRLFLDDCLSGRNTYEQYLMEYRIRVEFPVFSHLHSIFSMSENHFLGTNCA
jgi:hypothetical protein